MGDSGITARVDFFLFILFLLGSSPNSIFGLDVFHSYAVPIHVNKVIVGWLALSKASPQFALRTDGSPTTNHIQPGQMLHLQCPNISQMNISLLYSAPVIPLSS